MDPAGRLVASNAVGFTDRPPREPRYRDALSRNRVLCSRPMPSDIRAQFRTALEKARDEYIAAIKAHAASVCAALLTDADEVNREDERASTDLMRKQSAFHQAAENLREIGSRRE